MKIATLNLGHSKFIDFCKNACPPIIWNFLYHKIVVGQIPDAVNYFPHYSPWLDPKFAREIEPLKKYTQLTAEKMYILQFFLRHTMDLSGDVAELGVWKGGSAKLIRDILRNESKIAKNLYLFDSFEGMKSINQVNDKHDIGDFSDTSVNEVKKLLSLAESEGDIGLVAIKPGWIPGTFEGLENIQFSFIHIDLDLYESIKDALEFMYPRLVTGGAIIFDDYGYASCPGARKAVDEFVSKVGENVLALRSGQAVLIKRGSYACS